MGARILIADDERMIRYLIRELIEGLKMNVEIAGEATNGEECLSLFQELRPQIVITDIVMPRCSGLDLLNKIREVNSDAVIILLSAHKNFEYARQAVHDGAFDYLLKPIQQGELREVLEKAIQKLEELRQVQARMSEMKTKLNKYQSYLVAREKDDTEVEERYMNPLEKAVRYVDQNFYKDISLQEISDHSFFSLTYFSEQFKLKTGKSFNHYLNDLRVEKARELLMVPELKIAEIAELVGYHNCSYFIKIFKQKTGRTPNDFRKLSESGNMSEEGERDLC